LRNHPSGVKSTFHAHRRAIDCRKTCLRNPDPPAQMSSAGHFCAFDTIDAPDRASAGRPDGHCRVAPRRAGSQRAARSRVPSPIIAGAIRAAAAPQPDDAPGGPGRSSAGSNRPRRAVRRTPAAKSPRPWRRWRRAPCPCAAPGSMAAPRRTVSARRSTASGSAPSPRPVRASFPAGLRQEV